MLFVIIHHSLNFHFCCDIVLQAWVHCILCLENEDSFHYGYSACEKITDLRSSTVSLVIWWLHKISSCYGKQAAEHTSIFKGKNVIIFLSEHAFPICALLVLERSPSPQKCQWAACSWLLVRIYYL